MRDLSGLKSGSEMVEVKTVATKHSSVVVAVSFIINIALSDKGGITEETLAKFQSEHKGTIISTRTTGRIFYNSKDGSMFGSAYPLPEREFCKYGRSNRVIVRLKFANGTKTTLTKEATEKYWGEILGLEKGESARDVNFKIKYNLVNMDGVKSREDFENALISNTLKALELRIPVSDSMFDVYTDTYSSNEKEGSVCIDIIPNVEKVIGLGRTVGLSTRTIGCAPSAEVLELNEKKESNDAYALIRTAFKKQAAPGEGTSRSARKNRANRAAIEAAKAAAEAGKTVETNAVLVNESDEIKKLKAELAKQDAELAKQKAELAKKSEEISLLEKDLMSVTPEESSYNEEEEGGEYNDEDFIASDDSALWDDDDDEEIPSLC